MTLENTHGSTWDRDQVLGPKHILVDTKLTSSPEVHGNESFDGVLNLTDSIVARHGPVVHQLALGKILCLPRASMERWNQRKQFEAIWNLKVSHQNKFGRFNAIIGRWVLGLFQVYGCLVRAPLLHSLQVPSAVYVSEFGVFAPHSAPIS